MLVVIFRELSSSSSSSTIVTYFLSGNLFILCLCVSQASVMSAWVEDPFAEVED